LAEDVVVVDIFRLEAHTVREPLALVRHSYRIHNLRVVLHVVVGACLRPSCHTFVAGTLGLAEEAGSLVPYLKEAQEIIIFIKFQQNTHT
jgi:hypothetical protein